MVADQVSRGWREGLHEQLSNWHPDRYFARVPAARAGPAIADARQVIRRSNFSQHPIFTEGRLANIEALGLWASQELVTSTQFSQTLAGWMARIDNCNLRALILPVYAGEHGEFENESAPRAHPNLALKFAESLGVAIDKVRARDYTWEFIEALWRVALESAMMYVAGFFGVGNERLILREYSLVKRAAMAVDNAVAVEFLDENIAEDSMHSRAFERFASALAGFGYSTAEYERGAQDGIDARARFYDGLYSDLTSSRT